MQFPDGPVAAVTHPDPYPYYAALTTRTTLFHESALGHESAFGLWVAASADAVTAVLASAICCVRPPTEPIPVHLLSTSIADVFPHLVRMSDGATHQTRKRAVSTALVGADRDGIAARTDRWARSLAARDTFALAPAGVMDFAFRLPVYTVASLLGVPDAAVPEVASWMGDFVACLSPFSDTEQQVRGAAATPHLLATFRTLIADQRAEHAVTPLTVLADEAACGGHQGGHQGEIDVLANAIGLLMQTYEATSGLIGNTLVALATRPVLRQHAASDLRAVRGIVAEVLRHDPPIQNTRRFVSETGVIAGEQVRAGESVLVVLAAANRDASVNPHPERFDATRENRRMFTFGSGVHACPGERIAATIAEVGVAHLLTSGLAPERLTEPVQYRASVNARIPLRLPVSATR